jgi:hypothetical protein
MDDRLRRGSNPPPRGGKPAPPPGPPSVDFRALCAELVQAIQDDVAEVNDGRRFQAVVNRARAALAQQGAVGPTNGEGLPCNLIRTLLRAGYEPGDGSADGAQLVSLAWWHPAMGCDSLQIVVDNARAILARYARPDVAPVSVGERPTPAKPQPTGGRLIRGDRCPPRPPEP